MAQVIQHNIMALNAFNKLSVNNSALGKNLEKLSSGYKINRAADDAAGLAISEKMRAQITGLNRATSNAQDGISLVQTAEGALTEVHAMLNRMIDLATQASNGTYDSSTDLTYIQKEVAALKSEIDRIGTYTDFNGIKLLDGTLTQKSLQIGDTADQTLTVTIATLNTTGLTIAALSITDTKTAQDAIAAIKKAIGTVSNERAGLGALQNRLEHTINNLETTSENLSSAESRIRDTDMAKEMMAYTKNNVLAQAAQAMLAQANQQPQSILQLLR